MNIIIVCLVTLLCYILSYKFADKNRCMYVCICMYVCMYIYIQSLATVEEVIVAS